MLGLVPELGLWQDLAMPQARQTQDQTQILRSDIEWAALESIRRLEMRRKELGLSRAEVAVRSGLDRTMVWWLLSRYANMLVAPPGSRRWDIRSTDRLAIELALGFRPGGSFPSFAEIIKNRRAGGAGP